MRGELALATVANASAYASALANGAPDFWTKLWGILAGACLGALLAAVLSDQPTQPQRIRRFVAAFVSGVFGAYIVLWFWPSRIGTDPLEFIFVVSGACSFFGWRVVAKADARANRLADVIVDRIEKRAGFTDAERIDDDHRRERESGRVSFYFLTGLAVLALVAYFLWDFFVLVWLLLTTQVH